MRGSFGNQYASAWRRAFLRRFRREASGLLPTRGRAVVDRTAASAQQLFEVGRRDVPDKQGLLIVGISSLILAGYRELVAEQVDRNAAYEAVRRAALATYRKTTRSATRALLALSRDPIGALSRISWPGVWRRTFGAAMGFEERVSADRVDLVVTHCAFHQFFVDHGEPLLTRIVSEIDRNWMDEVNRSKRPIRVERPLTMSTGCERCEFRFVRASGEPAPAPDIVLERRAGVAPSLAEPDN